uniref:ubiquitinyl hydrolase 1 n=1 Tax=Panagrellus redivivus TaxID=6233 RepID=A0A7E4UQB5_PANRE
MADTTTTASSMEVDEVQTDPLAGVESRVPQPSDRVHKDECTYCFDNAYSEGGILISLNSFFAVCPTHIEWFRNFEENTGFVRFRKVRNPPRQESDEPSTKIQKLSINVAPEDTIDKYTVVVYPNLENDIAIETLPPHICESASAIIASSMSTASLDATWDGEQRQVSENAKNLVQNPSPIQLPHYGWKCAEPGCDLKENLWLNLTDGAIRCGRMQVTNAGDTLPGKGHAREYYSKTGYPIAVKLGTIANNDADIYDYKMDDACIDPKLAQHLAHFGIDIDTLEKTEKSTLEMELDLNQKWEWSRCCEDGVSLESVYGPGFTGIINIGSSCYINSVLQILSLTKDFVQTYGEKAEDILRGLSPAEVNDSFNAQMAKVVAAMQSGRYSVEGRERNGFEPKQFRKVVGQGHSEFSTGRQQDAEEYMRHLFSKFDQYAPADSPNPVDAFRFKFENRLQDNTKAVTSGAWTEPSDAEPF